MAVNYREAYGKYSRYFIKIKRVYEERPEVRTSVNLILTLLTISFFGIFALRPTLNTISELLADIRSQKEIGTQLDNKITNLGQARTNLVKEEKRLFLLNQALPTESQPNDYVRQIEALLAKYNLSLSGLHIDGVTLFGKINRPTTVTEASPSGQVAPGVNSVKISFSVAGEYQALNSFLEDLENLRRLIKISSVSFGPGKGKQAGAIVLTVSGEIPYLDTQKP